MKKKLNSIQAGRGIAALMVVLYHANGGYAFGGRRLLGHIFSFGFAGVDFFFVLSGFIIAYSSIDLIRQRNSAWQFLKKRFIRIYPIYWVYLLAAVIIGFIQYHDPHIFYALWKTLLLIPGHSTIIRTSWTLPFELVFYILFGLLIFSRWSLILIVPIAIISIINTVLQNNGSYGIFRDQNLNDVCTCFNVDFMFGCIAYLIYNKINKPAIIVLLTLVMATIVLEILYFSKADFGEIYPGQRVLPFGLLAFAAITAFAALDHHNILKPPKALILLGDASYTLYLLHYNFFVFVNDNIFMRYQFDRQTVMILMEFVVLITIYLSFILYRFVERPLIKLVKRAME